MTTDPADYLDTQTLSGGDGYFHTENAPTHRTDGTAEGQSPETPLVAASRSEAPADAPDDDEDGFAGMTNDALIAELQQRGLPLPRPVSKAKLLAALRGE